ncbi:hypothetical protein HYH03_002142 [Edaphochlamys debaryana]|uniref:Apyrase n=1 Tax=Edaphochlamys debaryana TaxID=47281 RepID=A0A835YFB4_9CHLO|nr:hypothetical protein HYH03_002142 [Edaphochlamys debaryana]|eukprot:KAG2499851.1 hypothetical protein HYH03_002142 [Edaphochlamys debaryana]
MGARRWWRLALWTLLATVLALGALTQLALVVRDALGAQPDKYSVYIDAGSSGTRVRVFRYRPASWPSYVRMVLPEPSMAVEPGLSAYATVPERAAESIMPLLAFAYEHVPEQQWELTPVRLLATAGLRLLTDEQQDAILDACRAALEASEFVFEPRWATVIGGEMEGLFGWAAVNYITGALQEAAGHAHHSRREVLDTSQLFTGLLEMGGASMQITFLPPGGEKPPEKLGTYLHLPGVPARLFAHSYLGLGMDAVMARAAEWVLKRQPRSPHISDPCLPTGYVSEDGRHGNASFLACLAVVNAILPEHNCTAGHSRHPPPATLPGGARAATVESYNHDPGEALAPGEAGAGGGCTLQDSRVPPLAGRFVAVENFAWTARALGLDAGATLRDLRERGASYCARHWSSLHAEFSGHIPDQYLVRYCFGAAYILALLHSGFGMGLDDTRLQWTNTVRDAASGREVGLNWVMGAAVVDAMNSGVAADGSGGGGGGGSGRTGSNRFWALDEHSMAAAASSRAALLVPLAALALVAGYMAWSALREARSVAVVTPGGKLSSRLAVRSTGGSGGLGAAATAWSSSALSAAVQPVPAPVPTPSGGYQPPDLGTFDPGLGYDGGAPSPSVEQLYGLRGSVVLKAATRAALAEGPIRRSSSFTSVLVTGPEGVMGAPHGGVPLGGGHGGGGPGGLPRPGGGG